ncbi:MAG: hypothetical protein ACI4ES_12180 [Roseburia sp.]
MKTCKECRNFVTNPMNTDGKCEADEEQHGCNQECCNEFKEKLDEKQLCILEIFRKKKISRNEYENYTGIKQEVFEELKETGCITGKGLDRPGYCYVVEMEFKKKYYDIICD